MISFSFPLPLGLIVGELKIGDVCIGVNSGDSSCCLNVSIAFERKQDTDLCSDRVVHFLPLTLGCIGERFDKRLAARK